MNNKGEKILSVYWFFILIIVAGGIVLIVSIFYGKPLDVREVEANILINNIADCLVNENGFLREVTNEDFLKVCHLKIDEEEFYIEIADLNILQGNSNLKDYCSLNQDSVVCVERNIYFIEGGSEKWLNIISVINKGEKNV